jgi:hypothetical protein
MSPENREAWSREIARCGDIIALLAVAAVCLIIAVLSPVSDPATWTWWTAGMVLLLLTRRAIRKAEPPS